MRPSEKLARDIREEIRSGRLAPGDRLPPVQEQSQITGLAPVTVRGVYQKLRDEGLLRVNRSGTTVRRVVTERIMVPGPQVGPWVVHQELPFVWEDAHSWVYKSLSANMDRPLWMRRRVIGPADQDPWCIETVWSHDRRNDPLDVPRIPGGIDRVRVTLPTEDERHLLDGIPPMPVMMLARLNDITYDELTVWTVPGDRIELIP